MGITMSQSTDELREDILGLTENVAGLASGMNTNGNPETVADDIMQLITSDRKRVELEARIDELEDLKRDDVSGPIDTALWIYLEARIAELKAQQEEV